MFHKLIKHLPFHKEPNKTLPNFLGLGAQKSGTTWLHEMLKQHPEIYLPEARKELMFFDVERNFNNDNYAQYFTNAGGSSIIGEITAGYLWTSSYRDDEYQIDAFRKSLPARVKSTLGKDLKFIVLLRHPVHRAISAYLHHHYNGSFSDKSISDCWHEDGIVHMGFYSRHLDSWINEFSRQNFHITTYEKAIENKQLYLDCVCDFFGINHFVPTQSERKYQTKYHYTITPDGVFVELKEGAKKLIEPNEIKELNHLYKQEIKRLTERHNVDTRHWRSLLK